MASEADAACIAVGGRASAPLALPLDAIPAALRAMPRRTGYVDVFRADLDGFAGASLADALSAHERAACGRIECEVARERAIASRALLRHVAAACIAQSPSQVQIVRGPTGKPCVPQPAGAPGIHVNASHSGAVAMIAVSRDGPLGIDVECSGESRFPPVIAEVMLTAAEHAFHDALPVAARAAFRARAWVCKEAMLKLGGQGLAVDPASFAAPPSRAPPHLRGEWTGGHANEATELHVCEYDDGRIVAAIATLHAVRGVREFELCA